MTDILNGMFTWRETVNVNFQQVFNEQIYNLEIVNEQSTYFYLI